MYVAPLQTAFAVSITKECSALMLAARRSGLAACVITSNVAPLQTAVAVSTKQKCAERQHRQECLCHIYLMAAGKPQLFHKPTVPRPSQQGGNSQNCGKV